MNRQQCIISLEKLIRFSKQFTYYNSLGQATTFCGNTEHLCEYSKWADEIYKFVKKEDCEALKQRILGLPDNKELADFAQAEHGDLSESVVTALRDYVSAMSRLMDMCRDKHLDEKGLFRGLPDGLDNEQAATLLFRAVDAGYLNVHFMPKADTTMQMLKLIAYGVGAVMQLKVRQRWAYFDRLWFDESKGRICAVELPTRHMHKFKAIMDLYPEVDFAKMNEPKKHLFYTAEGDMAKVHKLWQDLRNGGFIDKSTTYSQFKGVFGRSDNHTPVEWINTQASLAYFVYNAFNQSNRLIWDKCSARFTVGHEVPGARTMASCITTLKRSGKLDTYNADLLRISQEYSTL